MSTPDASMAQRIVIIEGHPDADARHFCHALADAYEAGAREAGHAVTRIDVARLDFPLLRSQHEWEHGETPGALLPVQHAIADATHLVLALPLWLGDMPALLKALLEQVARPGFAFRAEGGNPFAHKALAGPHAYAGGRGGITAAGGNGGLTLFRSWNDHT